MTESSEKVLLFRSFSTVILLLMTSFGCRWNLNFDFDSNQEENCLEKFNETLLKSIVRRSTYRKHLRSIYPCSSSHSSTLIIVLILDVELDYSINETFLETFDFIESIYSALFQYSLT